MPHRHLRSAVHSTVYKLTLTVRLKEPSASCTQRLKFLLSFHLTSSSYLLQIPGLLCPQANYLPDISPALVHTHTHAGIIVFSKQIYLTFLHCIFLIKQNTMGSPQVQGLTKAAIFMLHIIIHTISGPYFFQPSPMDRHSSCFQLSVAITIV